LRPSSAGSQTAVAPSPHQPPVPGVLHPPAPITLNFLAGIRRTPAPAPYAFAGAFDGPLAPQMDNLPAPPPNLPRTPRSPRPIPGSYLSEETLQMLERLPQALLQALDDPAED